MSAPVLSLSIVAACAALVGSVILPPRRCGCSRLGWLGLAGLLGLLALAALLNALGALGLTRGPALALVALLAAAAVGALWRRPRVAGAPPSFEIGMAAALTIVSLAPLMIDLEAPTTGHDAVVIWWPKIQEIEDGVAPRAVSENPAHQHPSYPRGGAWLCALVPGPEPWDTRPLRLLSWLFLLNLSLAALAAGELLGRRGAGALAALLLWVTPELATSTLPGTMDLPLSGAVVAAGICLSFADRGARWALGAGVAAAGAVALKAEGAVVALAVATVLVVRSYSARPRPRPLLGLLPLALVVPWILVRGDQAAWPLRALPELCDRPLLLLSRMAEVPWQLLRHLYEAVPPPGVDPEGIAGFGPYPIAWMLLLAGLVLGARPQGSTAKLCTTPAWLLLAAHLVIAIITPSAVDWHLACSSSRLLVQGTPLILIAAIFRLAAPTSTISAGVGRCVAGADSGTTMKLPGP